MSERPDREALRARRRIDDEFTAAVHLLLQESLPKPAIGGAFMMYALQVWRDYIGEGATRQDWLDYAGAAWDRQWQAPKRGPCRDG